MGRLVRVVCDFGWLELWHSGSESLPDIEASVCFLFYLFVYFAVGGHISRPGSSNV